MLALLSRDRLAEDDWEAIEDTLVGAELGVAPTQELVERLRTRLRIQGGESAEVRSALGEELLSLVDPDVDRRGPGQRCRGVVLVVAVNGTGKTTTVGKIARILVAEGAGSWWRSSASWACRSSSWASVRGRPGAV